MLDKIVTVAVVVVFAVSFLLPAVVQVWDEMFGGEGGDITDARVTL
jgi:hypothetical protein